MTEPSNESCPKTVGDVLAELEIQSDAHHKELAGKFLGLSIAVSFGSLAYLISLETLLPPATSESPLAIQISWCATYLSAILGSLHLWLEMLLPRHAYNMAVEATRNFPEHGYVRVSVRAAQKTRRFLFHSWLHHWHIILLLLAIFSAAFYRAANFQ